MRIAASVFAGVLLAACTSTPAPDAPDATTPSAANDTCGASMYKGLIGQPITGPGIPGESRAVRHITPGSQVTADYIAQRMNIEAGEDGKVRRVRCG